MRRWLLLSLLLLCSTSFSEQVQITSPLPLPTTVINSSANPVNVRFGAPTSVSLSSTTISFTGTGDTTIIPGVASQTVRVFQIFLVISTASNLTMKDGANVLDGPLYMTANGSMVLDYNGEPWFQTSSGNSFIINQSGTAQISGRVYYVQS